MSLKRRLIGNGLASAGSLFWTTLLQLVSVPVLAHAWGLQTYGTWLMLTTIPTYFALSDLGFATAATSDMTISFAKRDHIRVLGTFQSVALLTAGIWAVATALTLPLFIATSYEATAPWWRQHAPELGVIIIYSGAVLFSRTVLAAHRSTGHYSTATIVYDAIQALEGLSVLALAVLGHGFIFATSALLVFRLVNIIVLIVLLGKFEPWLNLGVSHASGGELRRLLWPALGAMAIPTALSLNIQGTLLIAGTVLSPAAAAILGPVRTASRIAIQLVGIVNRSSMPEVSSAVGRNDAFQLRRLLMLNGLTLLALLVPSAVAFAIFGPKLIGIWTAGRIVAPQPFVALMALAMLLNGIWYYSSNLLLAVNAHGRVSVVAALSALAGVVLAFPLAARWGMTGISLSVAGAEGAVVVFLAISNRHRLVPNK